MPKQPSRLVYSTQSGRLCPKCGWPAEECRCSASLGTPDEPIPKKVSAVLRIERRPSGKSVTRIEGLPRNRGWLDALCRELKKACGAGGAAQEDAIELQGDQRERLHELLEKKGIVVRG